ncbi:MAG TPA: hypothetical protein VJN72_06265 [Gaiellales bacterium]|nr:hypothetical protein [Gaiellales bacterium]
MRSIWEKEPVRVIAAVFLVLNGLNAFLLGVEAYEGGVAAAVTGFIAVVSAAVNDLFVRASVVPIKPLADLAAASEPPPV